MPTQYSTLMGLALPVQGELSGTWGDTVNNGITNYLDVSLAGTQTISGSQTAVTLSLTNGNASGTNISQAGTGTTGSAQYAVINCTGNPASLLTITVPASSRQYIVLNATSTSQSVRVVGVGPTSGVTIVSGERAHIAWNGSDFVKVASSLVSQLSGTLPVANGGTGATSLTANNVILGNGTSAVQFVAPGTSGNVLTSDGTTWVSQAAAASLSGVTQSVSPFETALGFEAGLNTTGNHNTFTGYQAGRANTSGALNTYVGSWAGRSGTTGGSNVAVGYQAMQAVNTGSRNNVVGRESLFTNTSGYQNNALGYQTLYLNTTGFNNVALGDQALYSNTTGRDAVAIGTTALYSNTTGQYNIGIGNSSLLNVATTNHNIGMGWEAGRTVTGAQNILIGGFAGATGTNDLTTGSNNILIGYNTAASSATVSNEVTIGNTSITSTRLRGMVELNAAMFEAANISATAATGTINFDARTQSVLYYTSNASANWTLNIRAASGVSLDSVMTTGESMTVAFLVTNGATAYYQTGFQVDGTSVTPRWQGGTAPTAGNASSIDAYVITVIKTGAATFVALASQTRFA